MARLENQSAALRARSGQTLKRLLSISYLAIDYPKTSIVLWALLSAVGVYSFLGLKLGLLPDITFPVVVVTANTNQIDVGANERTVTNPLETQLGKLPGLTRIHSLTYPEFVAVDLAFNVGETLVQRRNAVAAAVAATRLPPATKTAISIVNLNESPVATFALSQPGQRLSDLASFARRRIVPPLLGINGVLRATVIGGQTTGENASVFRFNGVPAVAIAVDKRADANTLDVGEAAAETVHDVAAAYPRLKLITATTQVTYILEASRATQEALGIAIVLAILVILPFLRDWRATAISAIAIPVSLLGTMIVMRLANFNLETITLLALALVVGVILDDAIVAVENIVRHLENGETPKGAALAANKEIGLTLVAASLTIVAVFLPIGLMRGTLGQFFRPFGLTASAAILFSLLAARTLSPTLAAWWLRGRVKKRAADPHALPSHSLYRRAIAWSLRHRRYVMGLAIFAFAAGLALIPFIPKGFIPHLDRGVFLVTFRTPLGTSLQDTESAAATLERSIRSDPAVSNVYTTIGAAANQQNTGTIDVRLRRDRKAKTIDVENAVRGRLPSLDGVVTTVEDVPFVGNATAKPLQIALVGSDLGALRDLGRRLANVLEQQKGFVDVASSGLSDGTPFSAIEHVDGKRAVQITADLAGNLQIGDADNVALAQARKLLRGVKGVTISFGGNSQDSVTTFRDFGIALALSILAIVVVLLILFRNWVDPVVITVSLPLSIVGALFALWITRADFGLISLMAVIFLFGLVNKNGILLVDRIRKLRELGLARSDAISEAGAQRLRPILMTTAATIFGMLPIALGFGAGAELRAPMAVAIIGGLITSTVLSLLVVPVAYTIFDDWIRGGTKADHAYIGPARAFPDPLLEHAEP
ncbi:MAG: efflux RND transporter permease subunit [Candidatus Eremiobacteraeota bacterium]|nr:efflux RND transporter permease subunit [Candidatus Eremiobacteraeota bacterium]